MRIAATDLDQAPPTQTPSGPLTVRPEQLDQAPTTAPPHDFSVTNMLKNAIPSAGRVIGGAVNAVRHPLDTIDALTDTAAGALQHGVLAMLPDAMQPDKSKESFLYSPRAEATYNALSGDLKSKYGSFDNFKNALETRPAEVAADLSLVAGGASASLRAGGQTTLANAANTVSRLSNPMTPISAAVGYVAPKVGNAAAEIVGGLGTRTGARSIEEAAKAGEAGGQQLENFTDNMRGRTAMSDVLDAAKLNLSNMRQAASRVYRNGMAQVSGDKTILDFAPIDQAVQDMSNAISFKGQVKNASAAALGQKITDEIEAWKQMNPADYHTPEGLDALKQRVGGLVEAVPFEEKTARMVGGKIYTVIRNTIANQAPVYDKTMRGYSEAQDQVGEIERALSLGDRASADTGMRKLQSLMRNNVNTNYGNRVSLMDDSIKQGGNNVMPAIAGQALNSWMPRGLGHLMMGGAGLGGYALGGPSVAIPLLAIQSPRLMGEAALKVGQAARYARQANAFAAPYVPAAYESNEPNAMRNNR